MKEQRDGGSWWRRPFAASGILRMKSGLMPRPSDSPPRRKLPRPTLAFNLLLLAVGTLTGVGAILHRRSLDSSLGEFLARTDSAPIEIKRIRSELADRELDEKTLSAELDARLEYARNQQMQEFYILLDTSRPRLLFKYGDKVLREATVEVGAPRSIQTRSGKSWTFAPVTGAFSVEQKLENAAWDAPEWVYAMNRQEPPKPLPTVPAGLGRYVLVFSGGYLIHSPPPPESPLKGAKPGSFTVPEPDLAAIWKRVGPGTRIYVLSQGAP